jgi:hypothetical protein
MAVKRASRPTPPPAPSGDATAAFMAALSGFMVNGPQRSDPRDPPIYWGAGAGRTTRRAQRDQQAVDGQFWVVPGSSDITKTLSEAQLEFYRWSKDDQSEWGDFLLNLGLIEKDEARDYEVLKNAWMVVLDEATGFTAAGKKLTPWDVARWMSNQNAQNGSKFSLGRGRSSKSFTGTKARTDIDLTDPASAKALVNQVLSQALGRAANDDEVRKFTATLNAAERKSPTTTTFNIVDDEVVGSTTSGGLAEAGKEQVLLDQAMQAPDYGAYQAARMVMSWLGQAIDAPV